MKDVFINHGKGTKPFIPKAKSQEDEKADIKEELEEEVVEIKEEEKDEFSIELKKGTDTILKKMLKPDGDGPITKQNFDQEISTLITNIINDQDELKKVKKRMERKQKFAAFKEKIFGKKSKS